jgi:hypothetical protein
VDRDAAQPGVGRLGEIQDALVAPRWRAGQRDGIC